MGLMLERARQLELCLAASLEAPQDTEMEMEVEMWEGDAHWRARARAMVASPLGGAAGKTTARGGGRAPRRREGEWEADFLRKDVGAQLETGCAWGLGGAGRAGQGRGLGGSSTWWQQPAGLGRWAGTGRCTWSQQPGGAN